MELNYSQSLVNATKSTMVILSLFFFFSNLEFGQQKPVFVLLLLLQFYMNIGMIAKVFCGFHSSQQKALKSINIICL